jgi:hypothetical protein
MERVVRWAETDSGTARGHRGQGSPGMTLRPTGMVVFATLDSSSPAGSAPAGTRLGAEPDSWAPGDPCRAMGCTSPLTHHGARGTASPWRRAASRTAAWLLGR